MSAGWFVVVERTDRAGDPLPPYVVGPYPTEGAAEAEAQSDSSVTFCLVTVDAKAEGYVVDDVFWTDDPPHVDPATRIIPDGYEWAVRFTDDGPNLIQVDEAAARTLAEQHGGTLLRRPADRIPWELVDPAPGESPRK